VPPASDETILSRHDKILKQTSDRTSDVQTRMKEVAMNTIVANVMMREAAKGQADAWPFTAVMLFSGLGLVVALCLASLGWDVSGGGF
jgi:hypothetical protein